MGIILDYVDVCCMLILMKVDIFVVCFIVVDCVLLIDMGYVIGEVEWKVCVVFLILIVKVFGMDVGIDVVNFGV